MKKIWNERSKEGVSPVIATILMVAITVVLAAVLYVMVMGMVGPEKKPTPIGSWMSVEAVNSTSAKPIYGTLGSECAPKEIRVFIEGPEGIYFSMEVPGDLEERVTQMVLEGAPAGVTATYIDLNYQGNTIGSGDYILINGLSEPGVYKVTQFFIPTDEAMTGGEDTFQI